MRSRSGVAFLTVAIIFCVFLAACGSNSNSGGGGGSSPAVTTSSLPGGTVGTAYSATLSATSGTPPYSWSIVSGSLPAGLSLSSGGTISGTPTAAGTSSFTVQVTDSNSRTGSAALSITIQGGAVLTITTVSLPGGTVGAAYSATLAASGGAPPYTWSISAGSLPAGLTLSSGGAISGTPTAAGTSNFTVQVTDSEATPATVTKDLSITILNPLQITTSSLPEGVINVAYDASLTATGGTSPYTWSVVPGSGALPAGLSLSSGGEITGTPTASGTSNFTVQVQDSESTPATATKALSITVADIIVTNAALPTGTRQVSYSATLGAAGGTSPYTWSLFSGTLPTGLGLSTGGVISGTPTLNAQNQTFTVQVTDSSNPALTTQAELTINITQSVANAAITGDYAFTFSGYVGNNNNPIFLAGRFTADGTGVISNGVLDKNTAAGGPVTDATFTGTYAIQANGLGTMTISPAGGAFTFNVAVLNSGTASHGTITMNGPAPIPQGAGVFKTQTLGVTLADLKGNYASGFSGVDRNVVRLAGAGAYVIGLNGVLESNPNQNQTLNPADVNDGGTLTQYTTTESALPAPDSTTGRSSTTFNVFINGQQLNYVYYVVSANEAVLFPVDNLSSFPLYIGLQSLVRQAKQDNSFSNADLNGASVVELNGVSSSKASATVGLFTSDGNGNATASLDENAGGVFSGQQTSSGTYSVAGYGRVTLGGGFTNNPPILYLVDQNQAFVVGQDNSVTSGQFEAQTGSPFNNGLVIGPFWGGSETPGTLGVTNAVSYLFPDGNGSGIGTTSIPSTLNFSYQVGNTGRAVVSGTPSAVFYVVSPTKTVWISTTDLNPAVQAFSSN